MHIDLNDSFHDEEYMVAILAGSHNLLIVLIDDNFKVEGYLLYNSLIKLGEVVDSLIPVHEKVRHWVLIVGLNSLGHLFSKSWEPHSNHKVVFDLKASNGAVVLTVD